MYESEDYLYLLIFIIWAILSFPDYEYINQIDQANQGCEVSPSNFQFLFLTTNSNSLITSKFISTLILPKTL